MTPLFGRKKENSAELQKEELQFNAAIEGIFPGERSSSMHQYFKLAKIDVPENATVINDGVSKYMLCGREEKDLSGFLGVKCESMLEQAVASLVTCPGVVFPYIGGAPNKLDEPRAVCMTDGKVFVRESLIGDTAYLSLISAIAVAAGRKFRDPDTSKDYAQIMKSYSHQKK